MSVIRRGLPDPDPGEMADRLQRRANQVVALENQNMELAAKLGEAEHQLEGAVAALERLANPTHRPRSEEAALLQAEVAQIAQATLDALGGQ